MPEVLTLKEFFIWGTLIGLVWGFVFGLIPLFVGIKKNKKRMGVYGLIASVIGGLLLSGIFSLIVAVIFLIVILKSPAPVAGDSTVAPTEGSDNT